ncbi:hypothetical protein ABT282_08235 [Streptomyces sp. NPDC000927]|uniref:hypothetical protein n=1 Tax=Streptomyces sp. NPDC000927 TaxID=3154371 RepID=UPI00332073DB
MNLDGLDIYEATSAGLDINEVRTEMVQMLEGTFPGTSTEHRTYFASLVIGTMFTRPGMNQETAETHARALLQRDLAEGHPVAVEMDRVMLKAAFRPIYDAAILIKADPIKAIRSNNSGLSLKEARAIVARIVKMIEDETAPATEPTLSEEQDEGEAPFVDILEEKDSSGGIAA